MKVRLQLFSEICRSELKLEEKSRKKSNGVGRPKNKAKKIFEEGGESKKKLTRKTRNIDMFLDCESSEGNNLLADMDDEDYLGEINSDNDVEDEDQVFKQKKKKKKSKVIEGDS